MTLDHKQIHQIEIIRNAFKRDGKTIDDKDAVTFALEFTSDILNMPEPKEKVLTSVPLAGTNLCH